MARQTGIQRSINRNYGPRRNMNGAGPGGRLVARRDKATGRAERTGRSQLGNREQRYRDVRAAFDGERLKERRKRYGQIRTALGLSQG